MLRLKNIYKDYYVAKKPLHVLKDLNLTFPQQQFVTILGPSGCGKTTLLNLIGGLDKYTAGDLIIDGKSTKQFKDYDWDAYRNHRVGFVFQSYNLIPHLKVLENVEISLRLSGIGAAERREKARQVLIEVGLESELHKRPNQLSGGQLQRVAIARALVNDPSIILADEPTGALDSVTSDQVIGLLKEISKTRLVIMVSHNEDLAKRYSDRIIRMLDGKIIADSAEADHKVIKDTQILEAEVNKKTAMSFLTALKSSYKNILTKKGRTILTALAGSLGIIGIGLVSAVSSGFQNYIDRMERETMASYPIAVFAQSIDFSTGFNPPKVDYVAYPDEEEVIVYDESESQEQAITINQNIITDDFIALVDEMVNDGIASSSMINYGENVHVIAKPNVGNARFVNSPRFSSLSPLPSGMFTQLPGDEAYMSEFYDVLGTNSTFPTNKNEVMLVIDKYNRLSITLLESLGIIDSRFDNISSINFDDIIGREYKLITRNDYAYRAPGNVDDFVDTRPDAFGQFRRIERYRFRTAQELYADDNVGETLTISGILRAKRNINFNLVTLGLVYTQELNDHMYELNKGNNIAKSQVNNVIIREIPDGTNLQTAFEFYTTSSNAATLEDSRIDAETYLARLRAVGARSDDVDPTNPLYYQAISNLLDEMYSPIVSVAIFATNSASKQLIKDRIIAYNEAQTDKKYEITPFDAVALVTTSLATMIDVVSIVLIVFTSISLVVLGFLIGIITYVSVIERTKEIGILRAIGARKKDISRLFNAETFIIGLLAGIMGVGTTYLLSIPINLILNSLFPTQNIGQIAFLPPLSALFLITFNILLTITAGLIPSRIAAKKDPVVALRTE